MIRDVRHGADYLTELPDAELVQQAQLRGDRDDRPFRELFRRHNKTVWHVCYNYLRNAEDAEDLTQEVFFKAYRSLTSFEGRSSFKTWIYRIAINTSQNELRRRSRRPQESVTPLETAADFMPAPETTESMWAQQRTSEILVTSLNQLKPNEREILRLKDIEERPYKEISELLGISLSAAKMRVQRARLALQVIYRQVAGLEMEGNS